jgi:hypothetical protein
MPPRAPTVPEPKTDAATQKGNGTREIQVLQAHLTATMEKSDTNLMSNQVLFLNS